MPTLLFAAGNVGTQLNMYLPILRELAQDESLRLCLAYTDSTPAHQQDPAFVECRALFDEVRVHDLEWQLPDSTLGKVRLALTSSAAYQAFVKDLLDEVQPDLVVLPSNKNFRYRAFSKTAALAGRPVLVMQEGSVPGGMRTRLDSFPPDYRRNYRLRAAGAALLNSVLLARQVGPQALTRFHVGHGAVTTLAAWGAASRDIAVAHGYAHDSVELTGQPRFDRLATHDWSDEVTALYEELGIDRGRRSLVYLPTKGITDSFLQSQQQQLDILRAIVQGAQAQAEPVTVITKLHRNENRTEFERIVGPELFGAMVTVQDVPLHPLLAGCALAITVGSTAGMEALALGKPLITMNFSGRPDYYPYAEEGAALSVTSPDAMQEAVRKILEDPDCQERLVRGRERFVAQELGPLDGGATSRVVEAIHAALRRRQAG